MRKIKIILLQAVRRFSLRRSFRESSEGEKILMIMGLEMEFSKVSPLFFEVIYYK